MFKQIFGSPSKDSHVPVDYLKRAKYSRFETRPETEQTAPCFTRFAPLDTKPAGHAHLSRVQTRPSPQREHPEAIEPAKTETPRAPEPQMVDLSAHLYSETAVSIALLRKALPQRFKDLDAAGPAVA